MADSTGSVGAIRRETYWRAAALTGCWPGQIDPSAYGHAVLWATLAAGFRLALDIPRLPTLWIWLFPTPSSLVDALKAIRGSLNDPQGHLDSWGSGDPCVANWSHVFCYDATSTNEYFHVRELQLLRLNLSGTLAPKLGQLSRMKIMDFMWNAITGSIPTEVGNITSLELLLVNGNQLTGSLPEEIGFLPNLNRIQIDQNHISGPIPKSFANLNKAKHFHMNNNSLSGQIPPELSRLPSLVHLLLDNNNLSGYLPPEFAQLPKLLIIQLDNNNFSGSSIPSSYGNITTLLKLSLRNCSLGGPALDASGIPQLRYLDVSWNQLTGPIPSGQLTSNMTTIDLSHNRLNGPIPGSFSGLPNLQRLSLDNNNLDGSVPSDVWRNIDYSGNRSLILDFRNNSLTYLPNPLTPPANFTILLSGNPLCASQNQLNIAQYCESTPSVVPGGGFIDNNTLCSPCSTDLPLESILKSPNPCSCGIPLYVDYRLKSPGFWDFVPYEAQFLEYLSSGLFLSSYQLEVTTFMWEEGPRLKMKLKLFPNNTGFFNSGQVLGLRDMFTGWLIADSDIFGPYELIDFIPGWYENILLLHTKSSLSTGAIVGIVIAAVAILSSSVTLIILRRRLSQFLKKYLVKISPVKTYGVKAFTFDELSKCTDGFNETEKIGEGGYGKVYKGLLATGIVAAIKRAKKRSLQGANAFLTEIKLLSRLHHRNVVALLGYCDEKGEQMLVYEHMAQGTLGDHLSATTAAVLSYDTRIQIALAASRGIQYLHMEANPPVFHGDIKSSNILLGSQSEVKLADFGISKCAPLPEREGSAPGHVSTEAKGTRGYLDPQYWETHRLTNKSDVYSLGVVFLELLTGKTAIFDDKNLVKEVMAANLSGVILSMVDQRMSMVAVPKQCLERFAALGMWCCQYDTGARPSIVDVVRELEIILQMLVTSVLVAIDSSIGNNLGEMDARPSTAEVEAEAEADMDVVNPLTSLSHRLSAFRGMSRVSSSARSNSPFVSTRTSFELSNPNIER